MGENFQALAEWIGQFGYPILFVLIFAESAGLPVPGETAILAAAVLASRPQAHLSIVWVIVVAIVAAVLGDNLGFWAGHRWARPRLREGKRFLFLTPKALETVEEYFRHYGSLTVAVSRFVAGLRVVAALAAGTSGMPWTHFLVANLAGAVSWAVSMSLLGYFFGQSWEALHHWLGRGAMVLFGAAVVLIGLPYLLRRFRKLPPQTWDRLLRARIWEGFVAAALVIVCVTILVVIAEQPTHLDSTDRAVDQWVSEHRGSPIDGMAVAASYLGSLPVVCGIVVAMLIISRLANQPWREQAIIALALIGSEAVGLVLLALIRHKGIEPEKAIAWPFGFAGIAPLRAAAVFGVAAHLSRRLSLSWRLAISIASVAAILLTGFSVIWTEEQRLTEVAVEFVAGASVLFIALWRLEGHGAGPLPVPAS